MSAIPSAKAKLQPGSSSYSTMLGGDVPSPLQSAARRAELRSVQGRSDTVICCRLFDAPERRIPVVILHGLQSHSGWFAYSAAYCADTGHPAYLPDRRGSGLSSAVRGDCRRFEEMLEDIDAVVDAASEATGRAHVHLLGHCYGTIPALAYAAEHQNKLASLILATPAVYTKVKLPLRELLQLVAALLTRRRRYFPLPFTSESLSDLPEYVRFAQTDPLALTELSANLLYQSQRGARMARRAAPRLHIPTLMLTAGADPIGDNARSHTLFERIPARDKHFRCFEHARHILEFSKERDRYLTALGGWLHAHET